MPTPPLNKLAVFRNKFAGIRKSKVASQPRDANGRWVSSGSNSNKSSDSRPKSSEHIDFGVRWSDPQFNEKAATVLQEHHGFDREAAHKSVEAAKSFTQNGYPDIKAADRGETSSPSAHEHAKWMNHYMKKMPTYDGTIHRGVRIEGKFNQEAFEGALEQGLDSMSSFSSDKSIAEKFAKGFNQTAVILTVQNKSGVSVKGLSKKPRENEVVVPKGVKYKIAKRTHVQNGDFHTYEYHLKEV